MPPLLQLMLVCLANDGMGGNVVYTCTMVCVLVNLSLGVCPLNISSLIHGPQAHIFYIMAYGGVWS